ncbi:uncharacterized protein LOC116337726 [Contarinia nasturtii]|uniref:uncharacterized protein LOC116337726 n=1 Tax=Contarinia nasturtii TaxID=265458 RepID=UPI0012D3E037|nr:uncharacterized protein LOC116337726 [Contarinia nasturtii]
MNKFISIVILMVIACASAKPSLVGVAPIAYNAPLIAPVPAPLPFVTATSSQVVSRNYNAAYVASPVIAASPYIASPLAYSTPYAAAPFTSPVFL